MEHRHWHLCPEGDFLEWLLANKLRTSHIYISLSLHMYVYVYIYIYIYIHVHRSNLHVSYKCTNKTTQVNETQDIHNTTTQQQQQPEIAIPLNT